MEYLLLCTEWDLSVILSQLYGFSLYNQHKECTHMWSWIYLTWLLVCLVLKLNWLWQQYSIIAITDVHCNQSGARKPKPFKKITKLLFLHNSHARIHKGAQNVIASEYFTLSNCTETFIDAVVSMEFYILTFSIKSFVKGSFQGERCTCAPPGHFTNAMGYWLAWIVVLRQSILDKITFYRTDLFLNLMQQFLVRLKGH